MRTNVVTLACAVGVGSLIVGGWALANRVEAERGAVHRGAGGAQGLSESPYPKETIQFCNGFVWSANTGAWVPDGNSGPVMVVSTLSESETWVPTYATISSEAILASGGSLPPECICPWWVPSGWWPILITNRVSAITEGCRVIVQVQTNDNGSEIHRVFLLKHSGVSTAKVWLNGSSASPVTMTVDADNSNDPEKYVETETVNNVEQLSVVKEVEAGTPESAFVTAVKYQGALRNFWLAF